MRIIATVTNDLNYDQRMLRICTALHEGGHAVQLVGRVLPDSKPLNLQPYSQVRLRCWFNKGAVFYAEYNLRLWWHLLINPFDAVNIVDLDTMLAGICAAGARSKKAVFDAHEHFTEVPEVTNRPTIKAIWHAVGRWGIPRCQAAYTVGPKLAELLGTLYGLPFSTVRNVPNKQVEKAKSPFSLPETEQPFIFYQGALNVGRGLPELIMAMHEVQGLRLLLAGEGDLSHDLRVLVKREHLQEKVVFLGKLMPAQLAEYTAKAWLGTNLLEHRGESYYYSLANKFFDYIQAGVPSLTVDFPEYRAIVAQHPVAVLLPNIAPRTIAEAIAHLQTNTTAYQAMQQACRPAAEEYYWEREKEVLLEVWAGV